MTWTASSRVIVLRRSVGLSLLGAQLFFLGCSDVPSGIHPDPQPVPGTRSASKSADIARGKEEAAALVHNLLADAKGNASLWGKGRNRPAAAAICNAMVGIMARHLHDLPGRKLSTESDKMMAARELVASAPTCKASHGALNLASADSTLVTSALVLPRTRLVETRSMADGQSDEAWVEENITDEWILSVASEAADDIASSVVSEIQTSHEGENAMSLFYFSVDWAAIWVDAKAGCMAFTITNSGMIRRYALATLTASGPVTAVGAAAGAIIGTCLVGGGMAGAISYIARM